MTTTPRQVMARDLQPGDRLNVLGKIRTVAEVAPTPYRGIVGNRPILAVRYTMEAGEEWQHGNTWADTSVVEVLA